MKCKECGNSGFDRIELVDYRGDGKLICGECADMMDIQDKHDDWEKDEDENELEDLDEDDDFDE